MLKQRVITAIIALVGLGVVLFVVPETVAETVIALVILYGAWEWSGFLDVRKATLRMLFVGLVAAGMAAISYFWPDPVEPVLQIGVVWWLVALIWAFLFPTSIPLIVRWLCGLLVLLPLYTALIWLYQKNPSLLLLALVIVWAADIGAYFSGRRFGRLKLAPNISPGKTWEGVLGGLALVAILAALHAAWFGSEWTSLVPFAIGVAAVSVIGDLTVSMFKRTAGLKDSGSLFPGHGGILDRVDSVAAAAPVFVLGLAWVGPLL